LRLVLDADVLIGALDRSDAQHARARRLFTDWHERRDTLVISVVNLTEVLVAPTGDTHMLASAREAIAALGVAVALPNEAVGVEAARLRHRHPISLPDAYCLATAKQRASTLVSFYRKVLRTARNEGIDSV
jgi:predicted nucleic acid-binding protein